MASQDRNIAHGGGGGEEEMGSPPKASSNSGPSRRQQGICLGLPQIPWRPFPSGRGAALRPKVQKQKLVFSGQAACAAAGWDITLIPRLC